MVTNSALLSTDAIFGGAPYAPGAPSREAGPSEVARAVDRLRDALARRRESRSVRRYALQRSREMQGHLDAASRDYVLLAGNSHAEGAGLAMASGSEIVNGGICGVCAPRYADLLAQLRFPRPPKVAMVFLGSNEIRRDWRPCSAGAVRRFEDAMLRIATRLRAAGTQRILLAAVPPLGARAVAVRDPAAVAVYTDRVRRLAEANDAAFFDPFDGICADVNGTTAIGMSRDGIHLADFAGFGDRLRAWSVGTPAKHTPSGSPPAATRPARSA